LKSEYTQAPWRIAMKRLLISASAAMAMLSVAEANAAELSCSGVLLDQRRIGVSLGSCDLNSLPEGEYKKVIQACGQPNGVGENDNRAVCHARAVVDRTKGSNVARKILNVKAGK
jgi:hypothetical protein